MVDYEAELVVVIGSPVRRADDDRAAAAIAGYTIMNDVSVRDYQRRTSEFLQGKTFEHTTPLGPVPGGIGSARRPQRWLTDGVELVTSIDGIGSCRNICRTDPSG